VARPDVGSAGPGRRPGPLSDALRAASAASGLNAAELGKATGCDVFSLERFLDGKGSLMLATVDKLFAALGLGVVGGPDPEGDNPPLFPTEAIRLAIAGSGLNVYAVARKAGGHSVGLYMFVRGECDLRSDSADGLFDALGLKVIRDVQARPPESVEPESPADDPMNALNEAIRLAIAADGIGVTSLARRSDLSHATISRFVNRKRDLDFTAAAKVAKAIGFDLGTAIHQAIGTAEERPGPVPGPSPWDGWDASVCPVRIEADGRLTVFGRDKQRPRSKEVIRMFSEIAGRYPGGFDLPGLTRRFGQGARASFVRYKKIDADTEAAFQPPGSKNGGLYRFGRSGN